VNQLSIGALSRQLRPRSFAVLELVASSAMLANKAKPSRRLRSTARGEFHGAPERSRRRRTLADNYIEPPGRCHRRDTLATGVACGNGAVPHAAASGIADMPVAGRTRVELLR
jgi:hypothetical protein